MTVKTYSLKTLLNTWYQTVQGTSLPQPPVFDGDDIELTALVEHTDYTRPGTAFFARVRLSSDGHRHINKAIENGASLIIGQCSADELGLSGDTPYWQVEDSSLVYAWLAGAMENFPGRELITIGITGTDGKTSTANILHQMLNRAGLKTGLVSTLKAAIGQHEEPLALHVTTPEAPVIQRFLRRMVDAGMTHCVLESTSIALDQHRVGAIDFDIAVISNITHAHLNYHGTFENYVASKQRLFEEVANSAWPHTKPVSKTAILNRDDPVSYQPFSQLDYPRQLTYALSQPADIQATNILYESQYTEFTLQFPDGETVTIATPLVGDFNVYNLTASAAVAYSLGLPYPAIKSGLEAVNVIHGRMHRIDEGQDFPVIVDFAHTHVALEKAIHAVRRMVPGRIITVFGSAGIRDVDKRHLMGEVSTKYADLTILTAEDPRTESLDDILALMAEGAVRGGGIETESFWRIPDRGRAIYFALEQARPGDLILIAGKGHEQSMCFGTIEYPWDDITATQTAIRAYLNNEPMPDLGLPTYDTA